MNREPARLSLPSLPFSLSVRSKKGVGRNLMGKVGLGEASRDRERTRSKAGFSKLGSVDG